MILGANILGAALLGGGSELAVQSSAGDGSWVMLDWKRGEAFVLKRGDTEPRLRATLSLPGGEAIDFTNATVVLVLKPTSGGAALRLSCTIVSVNSWSAIVEYAWQAADTAAAAKWRGEIEVTRSNGAVLTWPRGSYFAVTVLEDLR
jgi:hypothetical protein